MDKGRLRSIEHFRNLGVNSEEALIILEIYNAIPDSWKEATAVAKFQQVDELTFSLDIDVSGQKRVFEHIKSRVLFDYFVKELKESYKLQIKDGQYNFALGDKDTRLIFNRFRSTTLLNKGSPLFPLFF